MRVLGLAARERARSAARRRSRSAPRACRTTWRPPCGPASCTSTRPIRIRTKPEDVHAGTAMAPVDGGLGGRPRARASASSTASSVSRRHAPGRPRARLDHAARDVHEADPLRQERRDGDLVGGVQHGRARCPPPAPAARASGRQGNAVLVGRLEVEAAPHQVHRRARAAAARGGAGRSRSARACPGARSGPARCRRRGAPSRGPSTAGAPRPRSGRSASPNRWCASITSRPLFMSVAESIVIFAPIVQVGCRSASAGVTASQLVGGAAPERPPGGGQDRPPRTRSRRHALHELEQGRVLGVNRHQRGAGARPRGRDEVAAGHQALLVGQRHGNAALERRQRRPQARRAHQGVQHEVGLRRRRSGRRGRGRAARSRRRAAQAVWRDAVGRGLGGHRVGARAAGEPAGLEVGRPRR